MTMWDDLKDDLVSECGRVSEIPSPDLEECRPFQIHGFSFTTWNITAGGLFGNVLGSRSVVMSDKEEEHPRLHHDRRWKTSQIQQPMTTEGGSGAPRSSITHGYDDESTDLLHGDVVMEMEENKDGDDNDSNDDKVIPQSLKHEEAERGLPYQASGDRVGMEEEGKRGDPRGRDKESRRRDRWGRAERRELDTDGDTRERTPPSLSRSTWDRDKDAYSQPRAASMTDFWPTASTKKGVDKLKQKYRGQLEIDGIYAEVAPTRLDEAHKKGKSSEYIRELESRHEISISRGPLGTRVVDAATSLTKTPIDNWKRNSAITLQYFALTNIGITTVAWAVMMLSHTAYNEDNPDEGWLPSLWGAYIPAMVYLVFSLAGVLLEVFTVRRATADMKEQLKDIRASLEASLEGRGWIPVIKLDLWDSLYASQVVFSLVLGFIGSFTFGLAHRGVGMMLGVMATMLGWLGVRGYFLSEHIVMKAYLNLLRNLVFELNGYAKFEDINFIPVIESISQYGNEIAKSELVL